MGFQIAFTEVVDVAAKIGLPAALFVLSGVGWMLKATYEKTTQQERELRQARGDIYDRIVEPFLLALSPDAIIVNDPKYKGGDREKALGAAMLTMEYRRDVYRFARFGNDAVIRAFNNLMQYFYSQNDKPDKEDTKTATAIPSNIDQFEELLLLVGVFLLELRRGIGNESTKLHPYEMLEPIVTDIRRFRDTNGKYPAISRRGVPTKN